MEIFERMHLEDKREIAQLKYPVLDADRIYADLKAQSEASRLETGAWLSVCLLCGLFPLSNSWTRFDFFNLTFNIDLFFCNLTTLITEILILQ